uniref:Aminoglycoside phosphotransferase domain-containing protein n=1 Tax=viral metagenome TaxID=1070528 RepID=A0A6C0BRW4_9ZZZZ
MDKNKDIQIHINMDIVHAFYKINCLFPKNSKISKLKGGLTNTIYLIEHLGNKYIIREFGKNTEVFVDRVLEMRIIKELEPYDVTRKLIELTNKGTIESYVEGHPVTYESFKNSNLIRKLVGQKLRMLHTSNILTKKETQTAHIWKAFNDWTTLCLQLYDLDLNIKKILTNIFEIVTMKSKTAAFYPIVMCHNDLNLGNIIYDQHNHQIKFIDFEYASYNYRGYDIGNIFAELAGNDCNWDKLPTKHERYAFYSYYLDTYNENEFKRLDEEVSFFMPLCCLFWALWGLIQNKYSDNLQFDYLQYSNSKINGYFTVMNFFNGSQCHRV